MEGPVRGLLNPWKWSRKTNSTGNFDSISPPKNHECPRRTVASLRGFFRALFTRPRRGTFVAAHPSTTRVTDVSAASEPAARPKEESRVGSLLARRVVASRGLSERVLTRGFHNGILLLNCGQSTLRLMPPLMIDRATADEALVLLERSLREAMEA